MPRSHPLRVLVVDDHPDIRLLAQALLEPDPRFEVVGEAADGLQAIERIEEVRPDVVLLDVSMPGMSGLDVLPVLRRVHPDAQLVIFSAHSEYREEALSRGAAGFLDKTWATVDLPNALATLLAEAGERATSRAPDV